MILRRYAADTPPAWANDPIEEPRMAESCPRLVRTSSGTLKVLRPHYDASGIWLLVYEAQIPQGVCLRCGCTDLFGCDGGCFWVNRRHTLCSKCYERILT